MSRGKRLPLPLRWPVARMRTPSAPAAMGTLNAPSPSHACEAPTLNRARTGDGHCLERCRPLTCVGSQRAAGVIVRDLEPLKAIKSLQHLGQLVRRAQHALSGAQVPAAQLEEQVSALLAACLQAFRSVAHFLINASIRRDRLV